MGAHLGYKKSDAPIVSSYWTDAMQADLRRASTKLLNLLAREQLLREELCGSDGPSGDTARPRPFKRGPGRPAATWTLPSGKF
jgi:hypothetical protein